MIPLEAIIDLMVIWMLELLPPIQLKNRILIINTTQKKRISYFKRLKSSGHIVLKTVYN